jgi:hypothetical protein
VWWGVECHPTDHAAAASEREQRSDLIAIEVTRGRAIVLMRVTPRTRLPMRGKAHSLVSDMAPLTYLAETSTSDTSMMVKVCCFYQKEPIPFQLWFTVSRGAEEGGWCALALGFAMSLAVCALRRSAYVFRSGQHCTAAHSISLNPSPAAQQLAQKPMSKCCVCVCVCVNGEARE